MIATINDHYRVRGELLRLLCEDLVGPEDEYEVIRDDPITRYASGVLFPQSEEPVDSSADVDVADEDDDVAADPPVAMANVRYPSSMGMTLSVSRRLAAKITVSITAGKYELVGEESGGGESEDGALGAVRIWKRTPIGPVNLDLDLEDGIGNRYFEVFEGLRLFVRQRPPDGGGNTSITLALLNANRSKPGDVLRDSKAFFQPEITVTAPNPAVGVFMQRPPSKTQQDDPDLRSYDLLYRDFHDFAVGHGCSVTWTLQADRRDRATEIRSTFVPVVEVPIAESNPNIAGRALQLSFLARGERKDVTEALHSFCDGYGKWIDLRREQGVTVLEQLLRATADDHLAGCQTALNRMRRGVSLLVGDDTAWKAFQLANRAMLQQRARSDWLRKGKPHSTPLEGPEQVWRPFQLAFILICLEGIAVPTSPDRNVADLLWFPTGGGKTEAYLGLIAFTTFMRRLSGSRGGGVTALMRYTLRLLTLQQFERASLLICCCEAIRVSDPGLGLGEEQISIGLWVGQGGTPNSLDDARLALNQLQVGQPVAEGNPIQLHSCPWCGTPLDYRNYAIRTDPRRLQIACGQPTCEFRNGIPVWVVDEDVYNVRPTLVIATVDKFASIAWNQSACDLFNFADANHIEQKRPELIIQDELHLISGPLGTLVGLYETAIDFACTEGKIKPKIIASTATIRRAAQQTTGLFQREVQQFPPPGLTAGDSYFAVEAPPERRGTRMYVGLMAPGTSQTTLLVRAYASLLQGAQLFRDDVGVDPYWTLVGYFNSLRVLGGARMQVQDDVGDRIALLARMDGAAARAIELLLELTSRVPSSEIPSSLKVMQQSVDTDRAADAILATNMISVGVDVDRLGLMVVMGQPQSTSEYIQSTSRVGRQHPGLVVILFNSAKSRDRSHYEAFRSFHEALYRRVESTSVTPFSARARDRALHAALIAASRLTIPQLRPNSGAAKIGEFRGEVEKIRDAMLRRVESIDPRELTTTEIDLDQIIERWMDRAAADPDLVYSRSADHALLSEAGDLNLDDETFPTLRSMRDVDRESKLYVI